MKILDKILSSNNRKRKWTSVGITLAITVILTLVGIYAFGSYGISLFILTPFFMGVCPCILYGYKGPITIMKAFELGMITLGILSLILLIFAIEGIICLVMAAPIAFILTWLGTLFGFGILKIIHKNAPSAMLVILFIIPLMSFVEKDTVPVITSVVSCIEINADSKTVWKNVIEFPELREPTEFIFRTGVAYPINAKIEGKGVGAIRHCNFTTGSFVEPITVWEEERLLKFDVVEQPEPMKELSFWDVDAPHLHDYFVSKQGQFKLTKLGNGNILLEGTTYYYHNIKPAFYWQVWSNYIIHKIHDRVLNHIKINSEKQ